VDLSIRSLRRGAQIAGVYVDRPHRGGGIGGALVASVTRGLLDAGVPGATLHVRADNLPALQAYQRAGYTDHGAWVLALR
jgi:predicted GNAT family acetyltransferase